MFIRKCQTFLRVLPEMMISVPHFQLGLVMSVFVTSYFRSYGDGHMVFHFCFVHMMGSIEWFLNTEEVCPSWINSTLLFAVLSCWYINGLRFANILLRIFVFMFLRDIGLQFSFCMI